MYQSRLNRYQEKVLTRKLVFSLIGIIFMVVFLFFFGLKLLEGLSIVAEFLKSGGGEPAPKQTAYVAPPVLDDYYEATNSAEIPVSGTADAGNTVLLYVNNAEVNRTTAGQDGTFRFDKVIVDEGENTVKARSQDKSGNKSDVSNVLTVTINRKQPKLEVTNPAADTTVIGDNNAYQVGGTTDSGNMVTVNDHIAVTAADGSFTYTFRLNEGDNPITIISRDDAGNETKIVRTVTYHP